MAECGHTDLAWASLPAIPKRSCLWPSWTPWSRWCRCRPCRRSWRSGRRRVWRCRPEGSSSTCPRFCPCPAGHRDSLPVISVTRWMDYSFNIWPFTTNKMFLLAYNFAKEVCPILNDFTEKLPKALKVCQSGEISPNLVTLQYLTFQSK